VPEVDITDGVNVTASFVLAVGTYKLCYRANGASDSVEQIGIVLTVATNAWTIAGILPTSIPHMVATPVTLLGPVVAGDLMAWAADCSKATPSIDPTDGTGVNTSVMLAAGSYKLCFWSAGASSAVEQLGVTLSVTTNPATITGISPTTISPNEAMPVALIGTVAAGDLVVWASDCSAATPSVDPVDGINNRTVFTLLTGTYQLCYRANGASDSVAQIGVTLSVREAPTLLGVSNGTTTSASIFWPSIISLVIISCALSALATRCVSWQTQSKSDKVVMPLPDMERAIEDWSEPCPCEGCDWVGSPDLLDEHLETCEHRLVACDYEGCTEQVKIGFIDAHKASCDHRLVPCPHDGCDELIKAMGLAEHCAICEHRIENCTHDGCPECVKVLHLPDHCANCEHRLVSCSHPGCAEQKKFMLMELHEASCWHRPVKCPIEGCGQMVKAGTVDAHAAQCEMRLEICPHEGCRRQVKAGALEVHKASCVHRLIPCPTPGCGQMIKFKDAKMHRVRHITSGGNFTFDEETGELSLLAHIPYQRRGFTKKAGKIKYDPPVPGFDNPEESLKILKDTAEIIKMFDVSADVILYSTYEYDAKDDGHMRWLLELAQNRAKFFRDKLVELGIPKDKLTPKVRCGVEIHVIKLHMSGGTPASLSSINPSIHEDELAASAADVPAPSHPPPVNRPLNNKDDLDDLLNVLKEL